MKKLFFFVVVMLIFQHSYSQCGYSLSSSSIPVTCTGNCNGLAIVSINGGTGPFSITWNDPSHQTTSTASGLCAGIYQAVVCDSSVMCYDSVSVTVAEPAPLVATCNPVSASCGLANGGVMILVTGGTPPYMYDIGIMQNSTGNFMGLPAGSYAGSVYDASGCFFSVTFTIQDLGTPVIAITANDATCGSCDGNATANVTLGSAPYTYSWSVGNTTQTVTNLCPGIYTVTIADASGCVVSDSVQINGSGTMIASNITYPSSCAACDGAMRTILSGGTPPYEYSYDNGLTWSPLDSAGNLCAGPQVVYYRDANQCMGIYTALINNTTIPGLVVSDSVTQISGPGLNDGSIVLTTAGTSVPLSFSWSNGATTASVYNLPAGTYTVTISDTSGNCQHYYYSIYANTNYYSYGMITGNVYDDVNLNCVYDGGDFPLNNALVTAGAYGTYSWYGQYYMYLPLGNYTVEHHSGNGMIAVCDSVFAVNINTTSSVATGIDFGDTVNATESDVAVYMYSMGIVPGFTGSYNLYLSNYNYLSADGQICLVLPDSLTYLSSSVTPASVNGDTICWNYSNLMYGSSQYITVYFQTPANPALLGMPMVACAYITANQPESDYGNNNYCYTRVVSGSFDPNEKSVSPAGEGVDGEVDLSVEELTYHIQFQNTGNGPAVNIVVSDTLSSLLDFSTFEMLDASHNCTLSVIAGNILRWRFDNINLPDSTSDEQGSHGWIEFRIRRKATVVAGQSVENTAAIYFDFNPPVITNTTVTTFVVPAAVETAENTSGALLLYPNPTDGTVRLQINGWTGNTAGLRIMDLSGRLVYSSGINAYQTLDLSALVNGVYIIRVKDGDHFYTERMIISK